MKAFSSTIRSVFTSVLVFFCVNTVAQTKYDDIVEFDKTVHDFGNILLSDGPVSCSFTMKNISSKPVVIFGVTTSCGCTKAKWNRKPILPGESETVSVVYKNDEGPYPFNKTVTLNVSDINRPIVLRLKGICSEKPKTLAERFPERIGNMGLSGKELKVGNLENGITRSDEIQITNFSSKPMTISFTDLSEGLSIKLSKNSIQPGEAITLTYSVTGIRGIWGKNHYYATPVVNGVKSSESIRITAFTKESFSNMTKDEREKAARPLFTSSSYSFGKIKKGAKVKAEWYFSNAGKSDLQIYKVDTDNDNAAVFSGKIPIVKSGGKGVITVDLDTSSLPEGETLIIVTLTTNSPMRPVVNLFISGWIE